MNRIRTIGQGGLGIVDLYQAENGNQYAVKQMQYKWDENNYERFKREISIMKNLSHPNIVKVINFDISNGNPYYIMPFYSSGSLRDKILDLKSKGQLYSAKAATGIIYYLANALKYAHTKGAIHRDLKPENILFSNKQPIIADWGIGKFIHRDSKVLTLGGLGTKTYCAPEQWQSGVADQQSDVYSLGLIYRELLTASVHGEIKDQKLNDIVNKMTMQSPSDRYQSMGAVMTDINSLNIIFKQDPLGDFWSAALVTAGVVGLVYLLSKLFND